MAKMSYSDSELEAMLDDLESDWAERKEAWAGDAKEKGRQDICAFANDLPDHRRPGVLFIGARDDGTPSQIPITDELLTTLAGIRDDGHILPMPSLIVEKRRLKGAEMAVIFVQPADAPPVKYRGRAWIRAGSRREIANAQEERILNEKRRHRDLPFDLQPLPSCPLAALNRAIFVNEYLPGALAPDLLAANNRDYEERLSSCRMVHSVKDPTPTVVGVLVLGDSPRDWIPSDYVQFLRIAGRELADPIVDAATIDGPLAQLLRLLDDKLESHNRVAVDILAGDVERRSSLYPRAAIQQIARNAIMHRTYESTNEPVRVYWYDDRIEVHSPGGPFGMVTRENFGQPGATDYRNPTVSEAMRVLGFVQKFGMGIQLARAELARNGNPELEYVVQPTRVLAILRSRECIPRS